MKYLILCCLLLLSSCSQFSSNPQTHVSHVVLVWLKEVGNKQQINKLIEVSHDFQSIPGVLSVNVGESLSSDRPIVDDSFDVGIVMTFKNEADLKAYLVHPQHKKVVKEVIKPLIKKILVYDIKGTDYVLK